MDAARSHRRDGQHQGRKDGKLVNAVVKTYPDLSQFWTYKPEEFLKEPVYSRDFPPAKNLEP